VRAAAFLGVVTRALERHPGLISRLQQSDRFTRNARALLEQAVACEATYVNPLQVSQVAVAQQRLGIAVLPYWRRLAAAMPPGMGGREVANVYHAYATLVAQGLQADAGLFVELERLAATTAADMVAQAVANVMWEAATVYQQWKERTTLARVQALSQDARRALCQSAEQVAVHMKSQEVANTLWAFAEMGEAPTPGALAALREVVERTAPEMAAVQVSSTLLSLALLQEPLHGGLRAALRAAVQANLPDMNAQSLDNLLFAAAWFHLDQGAAVLPTEATFSALARLRTDTKLEELSKVQLQDRKVACARHNFPSL
jgi:hypothetical protein